MVIATDRTCASCPAPIRPKNASGLCRRCGAAAARRDPAKEERRLVALRAALRSPDGRANKRIARQRTERERAGDPIWIAYKRASGERLRRDYDAHPDAHARNAAKRTTVGHKLRERRLGWCPSHHRDAYQQLRRKVGAAEARRMIEDSFTGLDRQLSRLAQGGRLVPTFGPQKAGPAFTLGGVATGAL